MRRDLILGNDRNRPVAREVKAPRSPHAQQDERGKDQHVSKRVQDRIMKRQADRKKRDEAFRRKDRSRIW